MGDGKLGFLLISRPGMNKRKLSAKYNSLRDAYPTEGGEG